MANLREILGSLAAPAMAVDLGTANTRVCALSSEAIIDQPTSLGTEVDESANLPNNTITSAQASDSACVGIRKPISAGVVADLGATVALLKPLVQHFRRYAWSRLRTLACTPSGTSPAERERLIEALRQAGASEVSVVPALLPAALGAGLDLASPYAQMIVDIGAGVTDIGVIQTGSLMTTVSIRTACGDLHASIQNMVWRQHGVRLALREAEKITRTVGVIQSDLPRAPLWVHGLDADARHSKPIELRYSEVRTALEPAVRRILEVVSMTLRELSPKIACEIIENGIVLTGGGACLPGLADRLASATMIEVLCIHDPMHAVIRGARQLMAATPA